MSNPRTRKSCVVPKCVNTTVNAPEKLFFMVPYDTQMRKTWIKAMNRADPFGAKSCVYCCEDHFEIENDMENYIKYKLVGGRIKLKKGVVPQKFECQQQKHDKPERPAVTAVEKRNKNYLGEDIILPTLNTYEEEMLFTLCKNENVTEDPLGLGNNYDFCDKSEHHKAVQLRLKNKAKNYTTSFNETTAPTPELIEDDSLSSEELIEKVVIKLDEDTDDNYGEEQFEYSDGHNSPRNSDTHSNKSEMQPSPAPSDQPTTYIREDEFDTFGRHVANQLRSMPLSEALKSQNFIHNYLSRRRLQFLEGNSSNLNRTHDKAD